MVMNGVALPTVADILRHKTISMTMRDTHLLIYFLCPGSEPLSRLPNIHRPTHPENDQIDDIEKEGLEQQGHHEAHEQGVDAFPGDVADVIATYVAAHQSIDDQNQVWNAAEQDAADKIKFLKDKGEEIKMKDREEED